MATAVTLACPICDQPYFFSPNAVSVCPSCGHEVTLADPAADTPQITPSRRYLVPLRWMFLAALICLLFNALIGAVLVAITLLALLAGRPRPRCGNCGAEFQRAKAKSCPHCGASFALTVH
jgi:predicted amidophosphoribosyltransferase